MRGSGVGVWSVDRTGSTLADDSYTLSATVSDVAGNSGPPAQASVTVNTSAFPLAIGVVAGDDRAGKAAEIEVRPVHPLHRQPHRFEVPERFIDWNGLKRLLPRLVAVRL